MNGLPPSPRAHPRPCWPEPVELRHVADAAALRALVDELDRAEEYAVDTEFHRERTYFARLALLQVAWPGGVALVDPLAVDVAPFGAVLASPRLAVVHAADQDLEVLARACGATPSRLFDTQLAAGFLGMSTPSLADLVERLLRLRLEKGDQLTDWTRRPLSDEQCQYAAHDVAHLLELHRVLADRLQASGRLAWAEEECAALLQRARLLPVPEEAWWKLRQARQLRGVKRGVAQAVAAWRERRAQALDRPVRFILSDLALAAIAHRPPKSRADLEHVRNLDLRGLGEQVVAELLAAVDAGARLPAAAIRLPPGPEGNSVGKPAVALALAFAGELARRLDIDPALLATRADVVGFLQQPPEGRLTASWRHEIVGEPLARLVTGQAALVLEDGALVLEERSHRLLQEPVATPAPDGVTTVRRSEV
ncbi:MAG TPA: HRDC domain-containing protein [Acidimicrobiales bacterium]|nr:HRDC domain-containing protein [Acidimicrobiales bacterium]